MEIRILQPSDDRSLFQCGDDGLDRFFRTYAGQNQFRHHLGVTYVAVERGKVLGYATVAPAQIEIDELPVTAQRKLPRYPLPVLRLARLAVDRSAQSQGLGKELLRFVCRLAVTMSDQYGCVGIVVDAKPPAVPFYTRHGFAPFDAIEGGSESRPRPILMFLDIRSIKAASGVRGK
jgi:GNAT superfamily N-acetyltransferase